MRIKEDKISKLILETLDKAGEPLETAEIERLLDTTRVKILYRLHKLRGDRAINGKAVGSGKGAWIWWSEKLFK